MIAELRSERAAIDEALLVLERIAQSRGRGRGRPPKWMEVMQASRTGSLEKKRTRSPLSAEAKQRMAEAQKRRWAAYRKTQDTGEAAS